MTVVRRFEERDIDSIVGACDWLFAPPGSAPPMWDPAAAAQRLRRMLTATDATAFVALDADQTIGFCTVYLDLISLRMGQRAWLNELAVDPRRRSQGVGRALLNIARQWAGENGATHLMLDSGTARSDAHRFYRREEPVLEAVCFGWIL